MKIKNDPRKKYIFAGGIVVAVFFLAFGVISQAGYVFSGPYLVRGGVLEITNAVPNSIVFIDNRRVGRIQNNGSGEFIGIKPGTRNVLVAQSERWPWILDFDISAGSKVTVVPLQVLEETDGEILSTITDPIRIRAEQEIAQYREPTRIQPLNRANVFVWVEGTSILTQDGDTVRTVFSSASPIRNVFWYGDRSDAIIVATQANVFALDLRASSIQNFQPIYSGSAPKAVADPSRSNKIFVNEADQYFSVSI
ncbi:hypothetical protein CL644_00020 [bacterium]|nr:hypothetical protein [bacterium]|tara:strand:+ start:12166 stop:12921 length:756 start_codon:yes stop_codon:yes gene_type:complete